MTTKPKTLQSYKENLGKNLEQASQTFPASEQLKKEMKTKLFKEIVQGDEYKTLKQAYLEEKNLSKKNQLLEEAFEKAKQLNPQLDREHFKKLILGGTEKKESKESFESLMGWKKETFKIDSTGWKKTTKKDGNGNDIKVKESPAGDVFEYLEGEAKGEQIFVEYRNFLNHVAEAKGCTLEEAEKRYLMTKEQFKEKMKKIKASEGVYKVFFNKEIAGYLAGYWHPTNKEFDYMGVVGCSYVWLAGGDYAYFTSGMWDRGTNDDFYGFSGRLLKN